jgi:hypothetical protein
MRALRDPGVRSALALLAAALAGFVLFAFAWRGVARTIYVPFQMPWVLSAGVAGLALIGGSLGLLSVHIGRRADAAHRAAVEDVVRTAVELADGIRSGRVGLPSRRGG